MDVKKAVLLRILSMKKTPIELEMQAVVPHTPVSTKDNLLLIPKDA
jgi:hypothetical protein